jgi:hypothetical protein
MTEEGVGGKIEPRKKVSKRGAELTNLIDDSMENQTTIKLNELSYESEQIIQTNNAGRLQDKADAYMSGEGEVCGNPLGDAFEEFLYSYDKRQ